MVLIVSFPVKRLDTDVYHLDKTFSLNKYGMVSHTFILALDEYKMKLNEDKVILDKYKVKPIELRRYCTNIK